MGLRRTRADERGAALFIVMMVTVLLSAIGVYAVRAASLLEQAAGFDRKAAQAMYITEFGTRLIAADMAGKEDKYKSDVAASVSDCVVNKNLTLPAGAVDPCLSIDQIEMSSRIVNYSTSINLSDANVEGLLGRISRTSSFANTEAGFRAEITDLGPAPKYRRGTDIASKNFKHWQVTFTTTGQVRPGGAACTEGALQASSVQAIRSHVTFMSMN